MKKLLLLVLVLGAVGVGAELAAPPWVEARAEEAVAAETDDRINVDMDVSGPPLLLPVAVSGQIEVWSMQLSRIEGREVPVDVVVDLEEVTLDRGRLFRGEVEVTAIQRAAVTVRVDLGGAIPPALQPMADRLAEVGLARLLDTVGEGLVAQQGSSLVMGEVALSLDENSCEVTAEDGVVTTRCALTEVPGFLLAAFT